MSKRRGRQEMGSLFESSSILEEEVEYQLSGDELPPEVPNRPAPLPLATSRDTQIPAQSAYLQTPAAASPLTYTRRPPVTSSVQQPEDAIRTRVLPLRDPRKFRYDVINARKAAPVNYSVTKADRLDAYQAGALLHKLHRLLGVLDKPDQHLLAFDKALFFEHTLNGASVYQPNRGNLSVGSEVYLISDIQTILGDDIRRFFRAYADDVANVNQEVIDNFRPGDPEAVEMYGQLMQVAYERGMEKYPYLSHDTADACTFLTVEERNALAASKRYVLSRANTEPTRQQQNHSEP